MTSLPPGCQIRYGEGLVIISQWVEGGGLREGNMLTPLKGEGSEKYHPFSAENPAYCYSKMRDAESATNIPQYPLVVY